MSAETRQKPMRLITIRFPETRRAALIEGIKFFADKNGFAIRLGDDSAHPSELFLQLYRGDMKMIGATDARRSEFSIALYKTPGDPAPMWALDRAVSLLRGIVAQIPDVYVSQQILATYDPTLGNRDGQSPQRMARISIPPGARLKLLGQFKAFAEANAFAIRFSQARPDPEDFVVTIFRDDIRISSFTPFTAREAELRLHDTYMAHPAKPEAVAQVFEALRRAVEEIPGATFVERAKER
ncbi:hypothetical protein [Terrarubrum flagellatum]|uniref:hypothetical protein n=1 Tax=Terrirubrum flagellatum TaxID=2895980 RepID=UPI0031452E46